MNCKFCAREINNIGLLKLHELCCKSNPEKVTHPRGQGAGRKKGCICNTKGIPLSIDHKLKISKSLTGKSMGRCLDPDKELERRKKISDHAKIKNGGIRHGAGRGKKGWYKGIFCDSSWELAFVIYHMDNNINIQRNTNYRTYIFENATLKYYPDFIIDGKLFEIKGYVTAKVIAKHSQHPDVVVIDKVGIKPYIDYTISKYGKDFILLYEANTSK